MSEQDLRTIGVIVAPHGLQGTVRVDPLSDYQERYLHLKTVFLRRKDGSIESAAVSQVKLTTRQVLMTFESACTRSDAELLRGCEICVPENETWPLPDGAYYISDILGFDAVAEDGQRIGELKEVIRGAQDIFSIAGPFGEILVPFVENWVGEIDLKARTICIRNWRQLLNFESRDEDSPS
ncbi:ribosome maturation factor RimM [bacterium]|nr:ribosome maturation factor RimM [bacterium]MBU1636204.1 ribosome maturation factor RimM [bacterium]MBU1919999.1 ribosome maturation factor RimM [bacterium]